MSLLKKGKSSKRGQFGGNTSKLCLVRGNRKAELTTKQLVTIIILIASFVIILFLVFRLNLGETTDKQVCRNSVVLKGKTPLPSGPLDCKTNYLCVSGGGTCQGISQTSETKVNPEEDVKTQIMKALADEMSDCWWQFGEGKVNYGTAALFEISVEYAICSVAAFDENVQEKVPEITYQEFYQYLQETQKTNSQTYLQYLYETNTLDEIDSESLVNFSLSETIDASKRYSIITGVDNKVGTGKRFRADEILNVYIIPTDEIATRLHSDRSFITKT